MPAIFEGWQFETDKTKLKLSNCDNKSIFLSLLCLISV